MSMMGRNERHATREPRTVAGLFGEMDLALRAGRARELVPVATGFRTLDRVLGGGLHPGELTLVGGVPGSGKTVVTLQWARNIAAAGGRAVYICYEHEEADLLMRLLALEMGELPDSEDPEIEALRADVQRAASSGGRSLGEILEAEGAARRAFERVEGYGERLWLLKAAGAHTGLDQLEEILSAHNGSRPVLFVDYLQKVAIHPEPPDEAEKVTRISEGLKDLALFQAAPIVCVVASDLDGLRSRRLRLHHFRGSSALAYESDVALVLNEKVNAVSKVHLAYDPLRAETFKSWVVFSVEKNRGGPNLVDLEFRKDFTHFRFDPEGGIVSEKLVDERIFAE